ncbi:MAG: NADH-quinone oxidoreductase subunit NuoH [Candidatus Eremiobacterota bacterium]
MPMLLAAQPHGFDGWLLPLLGPWLGEGAALAVAMLATLLLLLAFISVNVMFLVWAERKVSARIQNRMGPMMTGPRRLAETSMWLGGGLQTLVDAFKLLFKEPIIPARADRLPFYLAPISIFTVCLAAHVVLPFGPLFYVSDLNIGLLYTVAISSLTVLSILMAGWSSNSKYSLLGGLRSAAQMLSYEIPMIFALLGPVLMAGSLSMVDIVKAQAELGVWFFIPSLLGLVIYYICGIAEVNRPPFDIPEAESELVAGYVSEYSGMMFAMFFLAEFANMFLVSGIAATVFLGGWLVPFWNPPELAQPGSVEQPRLWVQLLGVAMFALKTYFLVAIMMWIRWTFPRVRPDHLMNFGWKFLLPMAFLNLMGCALAMLAHQMVPTPWPIVGVGLLTLGVGAGIMRAVRDPVPLQKGGAPGTPPPLQKAPKGVNP